jgi:hypothetical protein
MSNNGDKDALASASVHLYNLLYAVCCKKKIQVEISWDRAVEVVKHFNKDLAKLEYHQGDEIATNKRIAGLAFWVRRIKPIAFASKVNSEKEITDINEQASVWMAHFLLLHYCEGDQAPSQFRMVTGPRRLGFSRYLIRYWMLANNINYLSLIYNLRYRNISPHHLALILDAVCSGFVLSLPSHPA